MADLDDPFLLKTGKECAQISQGAEARVWSLSFLDRRTIVKQRFNKKYRHPLLDAKLTLQRLKGEVRCMVKARKLGVLTPVPYFIEHQAAAIHMEEVQGESVKQVLNSDSVSADDKAALMAEIGKAVAKLHDGGLIHGDLTTSNMMVRKEDGKLVIIDFGLACTSTSPEDKGVDLYVLERALSSAHSEQPDLFKAILEAYRCASARYSATFNRFAEVRLRGRKRTMVG